MAAMTECRFSAIKIDKMTGKAAFLDLRHKKRLGIAEKAV
jgi:hypothetical protein